MVPSNIRVGDAAAAAIRLSDGRYLMQLRDQRPDIWYPGHWGCFGGAVDAGETPIQALCRELQEELELTIAPADARLIARLDFDFDPLELGRAWRIYYLIELPTEALSGLVCHEGERMEAFTYPQLVAETPRNPVVPYDAFTLHLLHSRAQV